MSLYQLTRPLGIATYALLALTLVSGLRRWNIKHHTILAALGLLAATAHALTILLA